MVSSDIFVHQTDDTVVAIEDIGVYPNGFTIHFLVLWNPRLSDRRVGHAMREEGFPKVTIRFADGRTASREAGLSDARKDDSEARTNPYVCIAPPIVGGTAGWHVRVWVFPLPPDGPVQIVIGQFDPGRGDTTVTVDGSVVRAAAQRAKVIWS